MSIGIYEMGYGSSYMQNSVQSSAQEKEETDIRSAESQQSTGTTRLTKADIREDGTVAMVQDMQGTQAPRTDKAEISQEGRIASAKMQQSGSLNVVQDNAEQSDETSSGTGYELEDLSEYSDTELKLMYYRGDITLQEYEDETGETIGES